MGLQSDQENDTNQNLANGAETTRRVPDNRRQRWDGGAKSAGNLAEEMLMSTEESVMANFDFLSRENDMDDEDEVMADETDDGFSPSQIVKKADLGGLGVDTDTEDVLKEFNFLTQAEVCSQFRPTMNSALIKYFCRCIIRNCEELNSVLCRHKVLWTRIIKMRSRMCPHFMGKRVNLILKLI